MLSPDRFIPLFEKDGAIGKLDEYMFTCVCAQLSQWRREGLEIRPVSVNLSRASLCRQGVALAYKRILEGCGLSTWMVPLEVTVATEAFSLVNVTCAPSGMLLTIRGACSPG